MTQAVSNLALQFGDDKAEPGAMVCINSHDYLALCPLMNSSI